ncbi:MAG: penicillin-binding protein 2 [Candidatus Komeilibacteria bacterium]|nr:penicillin-binding protein 2 [Candidatus Komeilibacteria bacterium]
MWKSRDPFIIPGFSADKRQGQVDNFYDSHEVSESFLVMGGSQTLGRLVNLSKQRLVLAILAGLFLLLAGRLFYLQFFSGSDFRNIAEGNRLRREWLAPSRGIFFDHLGNPMVENIGTFSLFFQPAVSSLSTEEKQKIGGIFKDLELTDQETADLLNTTGYLPVAVKENLNYEQALGLMLKVQDSPALKVIIDPLRKYPADGSLTHLFGYTSRITREEKDKYLALDYQLTEKVGHGGGLEEYYQSELRGSFGQRQIEVDALGQEKKVIAEQEPKNGNNLVLGIDLGLQQKIVESFKAQQPHKAGAVVAMDPRNGQIRALVSWPTYDNNEFSRGISSQSYQGLLDNPLKPLINRVIGGEYPTGSTIKLVMSLAGLQEGIIDRNSTVASTGGVWYSQWFFPDWQAGGHGLTNVIKALSESVNTFYYYLALENFDGHRGLGLKKMLGYFSSFGLGKITGIDLKGERAGFLPSEEWKIKAKNEVWYPGDTLHLAIGQGDLLATPLQVAMYTSAVANGGTLFKPRILEKIINSQLGQTTVVEPEVLAQNLGSKNNFATVAEGMRAGVTNGSSRRLSLLSVPSAGKTGTAQASNGNPHAWFTGFLPYQNPELVITVLVENGNEGSETAVPIAYEVLNWYVKNRLSD